MKVRPAMPTPCSSRPLTVDADATVDAADEALAWNFMALFSTSVASRPASTSDGFSDAMPKKGTSAAAM